MPTPHAAAATLRSQAGPVEVFLVSPTPGEGEDEAGEASEAGRLADPAGGDGGADGGAERGGADDDAPRRGGKRMRVEQGEPSGGGGAGGAFSPERTKRETLLKLSPVLPAGDYWREQTDMVGVTDLFTDGHEVD